jgi:hypothetical protein
MVSLPESTPCLQRQNYDARAMNSGAGAYAPLFAQLTLDGRSGERSYGKRNSRRSDLTSWRTRISQIREIDLDQAEHEQRKPTQKDRGASP